MGQHPAKNIPGEPLKGPNTRQGEASFSGKLNISTSKADALRPDKSEASSIDKAKGLKGSPKRKILATFYRRSKAKMKNTSKR